MRSSASARRGAASGSTTACPPTRSPRRPAIRARADTRTPPDSTSSGTAHTRPPAPGGHGLERRRAAASPARPQQQRERRHGQQRRLHADAGGKAGHQRAGDQRRAAVSCRTISASDSSASARPGMSLRGRTPEIENSGASGGQRRRPPPQRAGPARRSGDRSAAKITPRQTTASAPAERRQQRQRHRFGRQPARRSECTSRTSAAAPHAPGRCTRDSRADAAGAARRRSARRPSAKLIESMSSSDWARNGRCAAAYTARAARAAACGTPRSAPGAGCRGNQTARRGIPSFRLPMRYPWGSIVTCGSRPRAPRRRSCRAIRAPARAPFRRRRARGARRRRSAARGRRGSPGSRIPSSARSIMRSACVGDLGVVRHARRQAGRRGLVPRGHARGRAPARESPALVRPTSSSGLRTPCSRAACRPGR